MPIPRNINVTYYKPLTKAFNMLAVKRLIPNATILKRLPCCVLDLKSAEQHVGVCQLLAVQVLFDIGIQCCRDSYLWHTIIRLCRNQNKTVARIDASFYQI